MDRPYDGQVEQSQIKDVRADKGAGQSLAGEASELLETSTLAKRVANCEAAGLSFTSITSRMDASSRGAMDFAVMSGMIDSSQHKGNFGAAFLNSMLDTGGNKVSMDASSGKLLTTDSGGRTIDYDSKLSQEQSSQRNASIIPALFMGSPFALFGMGAALSMTDNVQQHDHKQEANRIKTTLGAEHEVAKPAQQQQNLKAAKGYISDISMMSMFQDKKLSQSTKEIYSLSNLAPELFQNQHAIERAGRAKENDRKNKKRVEMDKMASVDRKRQQMRVKLMTDRNSRSTKNLIKRKGQLENEIELAQGNASLAEVSRMHSELEVLDRALTRMSALGM
ncbi:MAG: hypothetical protein SGJ27_06690 [Candidatus Melainabacteria bacterium]|nr:hypothetical protein [Candidatus Melainabacteria bacterium]